MDARLKGTLQDLVSGDVFDTGDAGYPAATQTWDLSTTLTPPVVLVAATVEDIAVGARWADHRGLGVALLNTGHGVFAPHSDALVIATSSLNAVQVDPDNRRATVGPGARWTDVAAATTPHGLIGASGGTPGVGVIGYTLGGGLSPLGRTLGFAADRVTALIILDADYRPVRVDASDENLFWALRGGGPIGIVTSLEFDLAPIDVLYGGGIYFDGAAATALLTTYADWTSSLDERTTTSIALLHLPLAPQLPPQLRGRYVVHLRFAHVDTHSPDIASDAAQILAQMRAVAIPIVDATHVMTPAELPDIHHDPVAPQNVAYRGGLVDILDAHTIDAVVQTMASDATAAPRMIELRHLEGAYTRSPIAPSSSTGRDGRFNLYVTAASGPDKDTQMRARALVDNTVSRVTLTKRGQLNFYGPAPAPGEILNLWNDADADRLLRTSIELDPRNRIRTGRPLRP